MLNQYKPIIITLSIIALIIIATVQYVQSLINQPIDSFSQSKSESLDLKPLDNIVIPKEFEFKGAKIALAWTDDNTGEDLIIQSDKKIYNGFNQIDVFFSITNISKKDQEVDIEFLSQKNNHINLINPCERIASNLADTSAPSAAPALGAGKTNFYKATLKFPPMTKGEFFIKATGDKGGYGYLDPWYNSNWSYWKKITIASSTVATTTSNFPVLATSTDSDLRTITHGGHVGQDNGYDIVFADSDGETLLNFEREKYASTTGEIVYWIKTDISSTTDKVLYMYYGNSGASDLATTTGVWDDNFVMVQHLQEDPGPGGDGDIKDSTKYANNGTATTSMTTSDQVAGQVDGSLDFDGSDDYVNIGDLDLAGDYTVSAWVKASSISGERIIVRKAKNLWFAIHDSKFKFGGTFGAWKEVYDPVNVQLDTLYYVVGVCDSDTEIAIYKNAVKATPAVISNPGQQNDADLRIGSQIDNYYFSGLIDEVRISNVVRTAGWIETEYNRIISP